MWDTMELGKVIALLKRLKAKAAFYLKALFKKKSKIFYVFKKYPNYFFVETGTYNGRGVQLALNTRCFKKIYSIEFLEDRYKNCIEKFRHNATVELLQGDSAELLGRILQNVDRPCTFWLDAHGHGTPIDRASPLLKEIEAISKHHIKNHIILIDDVRSFGARPTNPQKHSWPTLDVAINALRMVNKDYKISYEDSDVKKKGILVARL